MQHLRLHTGFDEPPEAAAATHRARRDPVRALGRIGKGLAAFLVGIIIGASSIMIAETITPAGEDTPAIDGGPVHLRR
jgi:hypothetical protein